MENKDDILRKMHEQYKENKENISIKSKQRYNINKEEISNHQKQYWAEHAKEINDKRKEKVICECGQIIGKWKISKHVKRKQHQSYLNNVNNFISVLAKHD